MLISLILGVWIFRWNQVFEAWRLWTGNSGGRPFVHCVWDTHLCGSRNHCRDRVSMTAYHTGLATTHFWQAIRSCKIQMLQQVVPPLFCNQTTQGHLSQFLQEASSILALPAPRICLCLVSHLPRTSSGAVESICLCSLPHLSIQSPL